MSGRLPRQVDPIRMADEGGSLAGEIPGREFIRLREQGLEENEPVLINLQFERLQGGGGRRLHGTIRTRIVAVCQRCLESMALEVEAHPDIMLLTGNAAVPGDVDTLTVSGPVRLVEMTEDELLLAMPMVPMHEPEMCSAPSGRRQ